MILRVIVIYRIVLPIEFYRLLNKADPLSALQRKKSFILWQTRSYGYRGRDCRNNLYLLPTGETVYFIASVVVLYNVEEQLQRHYAGHNDDVKWWVPQTLAHATPAKHCQQRGLSPGKQREAKGAEQAGPWESSSPRSVLSAGSLALWEPFQLLSSWHTVSTNHLT